MRTLVQIRSQVIHRHRHLMFIVERMDLLTWMVVAILWFHCQCKPFHLTWSRWLAGCMVL